MFMHQVVTSDCPQCGKILFKEFIRHQDISDKDRDLCAYCNFIIAKDIFLKKQKKSYALWLKKSKNEWLMAVEYYR